MKIDQELTKLYYSIGEVADIFNVSNSLIRYWEKEFTSIKPKKNQKGDRRFTVKDIHQIALIYTLVKEKGFTLDGAKAELKRIKNTTKKKELLIKKLESIKNRLDKLDQSI